jgi:hypothetical protein
MTAISQALDQIGQRFRRAGIGPLCGWFIHSLIPLPLKYRSDDIAVIRKNFLKSASGLFVHAVRLIR